MNRRGKARDYLDKQVNRDTGGNRMAREGNAEWRERIVYGKCTSAHLRR